MLESQINLSIFRLQNFATCCLTRTLEGKAGGQKKKGSELDNYKRGDTIITVSSVAEVSFPMVLKP